jgi:hypothetical protein
MNANRPPLEIANFQRPEQILDLVENENLGDFTALIGMSQGVIAPGANLNGRPELMRVFAPLPIMEARRRSADACGLRGALRVAVRKHRRIHSRTPHRIAIKFVALITGIRIIGKGNTGTQSQRGSGRRRGAPRRFRALSAPLHKFGVEALCLACFRITREAGQSKRRCRDVCPAAMESFRWWRLDLMSVPMCGLRRC